MDNFKQVIKLAQDGGRVTVVSEEGKVLCIILSPEQYEKLGGGSSNPPDLHASKHILDAEEINRQITAAQLQDDLEVQTEVLSATPSPRPKTYKGIGSFPQNLPVGAKIHKAIKMPDLRQEVIDPSFDFDSEDDIVV